MLPGKRFCGYSCRFCVNCAEKTLKAHLLCGVKSENSIILLLQRMAEGEQNFVEIVDDTPLDIKKYTDLVRSPAAGAIATFVGTTRNTFEDKQVLELRYEAYVPMALRQLKAICSAARNRWKLMRLAVVHRLGVVPVGEESVFVAVSSVHRRDALEACEYIIDEIKASVPIWKKEVYTNGEVWKENSEFFQRKHWENGEEVSLKQHKAHEHSGCCGRKERVFENGSDDNGHCGFDVVEETEKESEGNLHCEGDAIAKVIKKEKIDRVSCHAYFLEDKCISFV
jgi:molybdopterin synthase catalytic subunit